MALMEGNNNNNDRETKEEGDHRLDGEGVIVKKQNVAMATGTEFLDFPISFAPLSPPVFQVIGLMQFRVCCHRKNHCSLHVDMVSALVCDEVNSEPCWVDYL